MLDNILSTVDVTAIPKFKDDDGNISLGEIVLVPIRSPRTKEINKHQVLIKNLLFTLKDETLIISNSLHKYFKDNNYSDFSYSELLLTIENLERFIGVPANQFKMKKLEFAINIHTLKHPYKYLTLFSDFKGREYDKMKSKSFWYGIKYQLTEYALKIYDKNEMVKRVDKINLNQNILRFEMQYFRSRKIPSVNTLEDLKVKSNIIDIYQNFINIIKKLNCIGEENFDEISSRDREIYFAGQNSRFWNLEKELNNNTSKDKIKRFRQIQAKITNRDVLECFLEKLEDKFNRLINS